MNTGLSLVFFFKSSCWDLAKINKVSGAQKHFFRSLELGFFFVVVVVMELVFVNAIVSHYFRELTLKWGVNKVIFDSWDSISKSVLTFFISQGKMSLISKIRNYDGIIVLWMWGDEWGPYAIQPSWVKRQFTGTVTMINEIDCLEEGERKQIGWLVK